MILDPSKSLNIILIIVVGVLIGFLVKNSKELTNVENNLDYANEQVEVWRDKDGLSHAKIVELNTSLEALEITHEEELDSLLKKIDGLKLKNLNSVTYITSTVTDTVYVPVDSTGAFSFVDDFTFLSGNIFDSSIKLKYKIRVPINVVSYKDKKSFFSFKKKDYVEIYSENPNVLLTGVRKIDVTPYKRRLGLGFNFSYGVGSQGLGFHLGFGVQYRVL